MCSKVRCHFGEEQTKKKKGVEKNKKMKIVALRKKEKSSKKCSRVTEGFLYGNVRLSSSLNCLHAVLNTEKEIEKEDK